MTRAPILFLNVLILAACGLVYELQAATLSSFVLGDSVTQYSLVIGLYLSAMGLGAWLSGHIEKGLARTFLEVELAVALIGGFSVPALYLCFARTGVFLPLLYTVVVVVGTLVGLELPILMRILRDELDFKDLVSRVLTFDYLGALAASVLFPLLFVPQLGLVRTSLVIGAINAGVALWGTWALRPLLAAEPLGLRIRALGLIAILGVAYWQADAFLAWVEEEQFDGQVLYARTTPYQRIVFAEAKQGGFNLYLNAHLQFASFDEHRYHEALAHPAMLASGQRRRVLILGGGDGLALREALRYRDVEEVTLVDIDPEMTGLSRRLPRLAELNQHAYDDPRVSVINQDAFVWLSSPSSGSFDVALIDFPDPHSYSLGKLYTTRFFRLLRERLSSSGSVGIQATSPLTTRRSFWCIMKTLKAAGFHVRPYQASVPSFGVWGFGLARKEPFPLPRGPLPQGLRFLNGAVLESLFVLPPDLDDQGLEVEVNRLDNQWLVRYYEKERKIP
jgi:spermidine synthase